LGDVDRPHFSKGGVVGLGEVGAGFAEVVVEEA
jgi:hypothetical protein